MRKEIRFYEYSGFSLDDGKESTDLDLFPGRAEDLEYLKRVASSLVQGKEVFSFGNNSIKSNSIVGVISVGQTHIEILPKLIRPKNSPSDNSILKNLMFMLSYTHSLDVDDVGLANLASNHHSFIEAYIGIFAARLQKHLLKTGTPKSYIETTENFDLIPFS